MEELPKIEYGDVTNDYYFYDGDIEYTYKDVEKM